MKFNSIFLIFFIGNLAFAEEIEWLRPYLKAKEIKCNLNTDQLKEQVSAHLNSLIKQLDESLRAKGSAFEAIQQDRNNVGLVPVQGQPVFDFIVRENVNVLIQQYAFQVQTTYIDSESLKVEKNLWLPLTINDPGVDKPCKLGRIALAENQRKFLPRVDLVIGEPARIVATDLVQVMDVSDQPTVGHVAGTTPAATPAPAPPPKPTPKPDDSEEKRTESRRERRERQERRERRESREERRRKSESRESRQERREKERQRRRHHRRQRVEEESQPKSPSRTPPEKQTECSGDLSPWQAIGCAVSGRK